MSAVAADALPPGTRLGRYEILRVLGRGGFGITYAARVQGRPGEMVAIKEWFPAGMCLRAPDARILARRGADSALLAESLGMFRREAEIICSLRHANLVRGVEWFAAHNTVCLVMNYVAGKNLKEHLGTPGGSFQITLASIRQLCQGVLSALDCLHSHGLIHGDIKPDNIFLGAGFEPVLIDLGSAASIRGTSSDTSGTYSLHYSAIEQIQPEAGLIGPWTDIYQFGAVLYRCIADGKPPDAAARAGQHPDGYVSLASPLLGIRGFPMDFLRAVDSALALAPRKRPQTVAEWRRLMGPLNTSGPAQPAKPISPPPPPSPPPVPPASPPRLHRPEESAPAAVPASPLVVAGFILVLLIVIAILMLFADGG